MIKLNFDKEEFENLVYEFAYLVSNGWKREIVYDINNIKSSSIDIFQETKYGWYKKDLINKIHYTYNYDHCFDKSMESKYFSLEQALDQAGFYD